MAKRKKNRRIKKPKYLSLRLQFPGEKVLHKSIDHVIPVPNTTTTTTTDDNHHQQEDDNMEYLLSTSDGGATTTLTGLLLESDAVPVQVSSSDVDRAGDDQLSPSASVSYVSDEAMNLVLRTALRSRERESSNEERYVRYSEVVNDDQIRRDHEEVTSSRVGGGDYYCMKNHDYLYHHHQYHHNQTSSATRLRRLSLKLDYEEIINAWSDKGGFYVHSDLPQTVPDINHHLFCPPISNVGGGLWSVPEVNGWGEPMLKMEEEEEVVVGVPKDEAEEEVKWKATAGQREASVLRYKEKRRNRLFSKTIRYQVRKENAQKRPRVKGRFVKRS